jgi:hypothetical protein
MADSVTEAINHADSLLPGLPAPEGQEDARWQAIIRVGDYIESEPEAVWEFVLRWGTCQEEDVRDAIACCLLEHLLEHHFDLLFPRLERAVEDHPLFADTLGRCWKFGQAQDLGNSARLDVLLDRERRGV